MKIKHTLASAKDKKPTITNVEMSKLIKTENIDTIKLYYKDLDIYIDYEKTRSGKTWYCKKLPNYQFEIPKIGNPIYYNVEGILSDNNNKNIYDNIRQWAISKGIIDKGDPKTQLIKLFEESGELSKAILNNDNDEFIDAIGDCVIVLTNLCAIKKLKIEDCILSAYNVIKNRTGKMQNGTFVKNK